MTTCPGFTELVKCEADGDRTLAWGWTQSTGQGGSYPYTPPTGWEFDSRYSDEWAPNGSHGGCASCQMHLVHLISTSGSSGSSPTGEHPTSGIVIDYVSRSGSGSNIRYTTSGQELRHCSKSGHKEYWHGDSYEGIYGAFTTCYITESVYGYMTKAEIESVRSMIKGILPNSYAEKKWTDLGYGSFDCWDYKSGIEARPLDPIEPPASVTLVDWTLPSNAVLGSATTQAYATLNITNDSLTKSISVMAVVAGTSPSGSSLSGNSGNPISAGQSKTFTVIVNIPSGQSTGNYSLYADVYLLDGYPNSELLATSGPKTLTISECNTPLCSITLN